MNNYDRTIANLKTIIELQELKNEIDRVSFNLFNGREKDKVVHFKDIEKIIDNRISKLDD